jgi:hypothetical protein
MMHRNRLFLSHGSAWRAARAALAAFSFLACSSGTTTTTTADGGAVPSDGGLNVDGVAACATPGGPDPGPVDDHCSLPDGGMTVRPTSAASCQPDVGAPGNGGGDQGCAYGATMFGQESDDDDCKYHVTWSSTPICEGASGVVFTVVVTNKGDGTPVTGAMPRMEAFTTTPGDWDSAAFCDTMSTHPSPGGGAIAEGPPGTYTGTIEFDRPGQWTVRFHFHEDCLDVLPDSPHGHAAYHVAVP